MADRTQAPSGAGYALENRLIVSRAFPAAVSATCDVQHLARFFATCAIRCCTSRRTGDGPPLVVLLTPGPYNETYFEHALLARYLGFPLVEGGDLTVRDGRVWLKTIGGLSRVHAILRRQDDDYCDPLELRSDSALGVAGLTDCARRGTVLIANALGSGVLESGALLGFLPRLARAPAGRAAAAAVDRDLVVRRTGGAGGCARARIGIWCSNRPIRCSDGTGVRPGPGRDGAGRTAQESRSASRSASSRRNWCTCRRRRCWRALRLGSRRAASACACSRCVARRLRGHARRPDPRCQQRRCARGVDAARRRIEGHLGDVGRAGRYDASRCCATTVTAADLVRARAGMPSRVVENLFWFGRYEERCDDAARLLRLALNQKLQESDDEENSLSSRCSRWRAAFGLHRNRAKTTGRRSARGAVRRGKPVRPAGESACAASRSPSTCAIACRSTTGAPSTG